jgi:UTP--glucose-1-phosphate uridylyltransferase
MLPLVDKPLIQYVVEEAVASGIEQVIIITGRGKRAIEDHFDISFELEETLRQRKQDDLLHRLRKISDMANFCYIRQSEPRGLGHAILCAKQLIGNEPFAVLLGDEVLSHPTPALRQMIEVYQERPAPLIGVQRVAPEEVSHYGIIDVTEADQRNLYNIKDLVEKPPIDQAPSNLAIIGRYLLPPEIFDFLEKTKPGKNNEIQLTDALKGLAAVSPMLGYLIEGTRFDAGNKLGFLMATVEIALQNEEVGEAFRHYLKGLTL